MSDQIESAAALMVRDYLILAFLISLGALQVAVTISGIRGLWLTPSREMTRYLGIVVMLVGIAYYIFSPLWIEGPWAAGSVIDGTSEDRQWGTADFSEISGVRNLNDIHGGMAGTAYAIYFVLSAVLATLFAAIIGAINFRLFRSKTPGAPEENGDEATLDGLDALKNSDAFATLTRSLKELRNDGPEDVREAMRSAHRWSIPSMIGRMWRD